MKFKLGPGPGARLLAPGLPDIMQAHAGRLGWLGRAALFLTDGADVVAHGPVHAQHLCAGPTWTAWSDDGDRIQVRDDDATLDDLDAPLVQAVGPLAVVRAGAERRALGATLTPLPLGARTGRVVAWSDGQGLAWSDGETLYRRTLEGPVRVVGSLPARVRHLCAGPRGALLASCDDGSFLAAPSRAPRPLSTSISVEGALFSADSTQLLARNDTGVHLITVDTGRVERTWPGAVIPVGFAPHPVLLDEDHGALIGFDLPPLLPCPTAATPGWVFGPGGAAWDLSRGAEAWRDEALVDAWALAPIDGQLACLVGRKVVVLDAATGAARASWFVPRSLAATAEDVLDLRANDGRLVVQTIHGCAAFAPHGDALGPARLPAESPTPQDHPLVELLGADGAQLVGGRLFAWTDDGALACVPA